MTTRERRRYWIRERNKQIRIIQPFKKKIASDLRYEYNRFAAAVEAGNGRGYANTLFLSNRIENSLRTLYSTVGVRYARQAFNDRTVRKGFFTPSEWIQAILQYLGDNFYNRGVLRITETTRKHFLDILDKAFNEGWGALETAEYIRKDPAIETVIQNRAEMIARTETGRAIHSGQFVGADKSPFEKEKIWISAKDNRTRGNPFNGQKDKADHYHMDGQTVGINTKFTDDRSNVDLMHPHDPTAPAKDVIQCRCTMAVINKVDENGRLIRKPSALFQ
jgi:hypothetical protein